MQSIVIHYSEIGTKGKNRDFFEKKLMENVRSALGNKVNKVYRRYGRIIAELITKEGVAERLSLLPGVAYFSFAWKTGLEMDEIKRKAKEVLEKEEFKSFKVESSRSNKNFPLKSPEISQEVGRFLEEKLGKEADYQKPERTVYIEVGEKEAFIYAEKIPGVGGLPVGTAGKVVCSLSGGIDSPVASFLMMKRGCKVVFVHVLNKTQKGGVRGKVEEIVEQLSKAQLNSKLYIIPFEKLQKKIIMRVPAKLRMIVYRRFMMRIINLIVSREKARGIVTGDSVGQVASQTLENLNCIYEAAQLPVFAPLIGMNKEEIVSWAKKIGTYELSIQPYPDCCSFMIALHPETKGRLGEIKKVEENIKEIEGLVEEAVEEGEVKVVGRDGSYV